MCVYIIRGGAEVGDFYKYHPRTIPDREIFINTIP